MVATTSVASAVATAVVVRVNKTEGCSVAWIAAVGVAAGVPLAASSVSVALAGSPAVSDLDVAVTCDSVAVNSCAAVALPVILASTANVASDVAVTLAARVAVASSALGFRSRWVAIAAALRFLGVRSSRCAAVSVAGSPVAVARPGVALNAVSSSAVPTISGVRLSDIDSVCVALAAATASVAEAVAVSVSVAVAETAAVALSVALIVALELGVVVVTVADTSASAGGIAVTVTPLVDVTRGVTVSSTPRAVGEIVVVTIAVLVAVVSA